MAKNTFKEFPISSWAIENRTTIFLMTFIVTLIGLVSFQSLPKENFPEVAFPVIYVSTPYPGTSPQDIENLVTRKIEKEVNSIEGIKKINSTSIQDFSSVFIEFETTVDLEEAKLDVKDAVDQAKSELPTDLPADPQVLDINMSEVPIMFLNISGNYDNVTLKRYAEDLQEEIEKIGEIRRVDIVGAPEREIQVNVDLNKMQAINISLSDIESAIAGENVIISGGELDIQNQKVSVRVNGEFKTMEDIGNIIIRSMQGNTSYLRDIAEVVDGFEETASYARLEGQSVITLNVIKKAGENLVFASQKINALLDQMKKSRLPEGLTLTLTADQSVMTVNQLQELTNTIIFGFLLVTLVLMFFMGVRDALFVGLAIPLASFISFMFIPSFGFTLNIVVLFSFILAMGIVVDNAIVVIENTYRIYTEENLPIVQAAKKAAGEVIAPVFAGTLTTICPFLPLLFWPGTTGDFMKYIPIVLIITLFASLFVAYVINPVFAVQFMRKSDPHSPQNKRRVWIYTAILIVLGIGLHMVSLPIMANLMIFIGLFLPFEAYILRYIINGFQSRTLPALKNGYRNILRWSLTGWNPLIVSVVILFILILSVFTFTYRVESGTMRFVLFPEGEPNFVYVYNELPTGTNIEVTDSITRILEERTNAVLADNSGMAKTTITNIAVGAGDANSFDQGSSKPNKGKITVEFVGVKERKGRSTRQILETVRKELQGISGTQVTVEQEPTGPPGSAPIQIEVYSENFDSLMAMSTDLYAYLDSLNIDGVEKLKWDVDEKRPEVLISINREKAQELGISTGQIGSAIRTAVFGKEAAKFRTLEDEYPIQVRLQKKYREDLTALVNMNISFMDQSNGQFKSIPISAIADVEFTEAYGGINRTDLKKSVSFTSNILTGYDVNQVNAEIQYFIDQFEDQGRSNSAIDEIKIGGQMEDQQKEGAFLGQAFGYAILLILLILVTQFNSISNVVIILSQVLLSVVGVFLFYGITGSDFSVVLSGVGIVVLTGIVVNNGIILLDFVEVKRKEGLPLKEAIIEGSAIRLTPVLLTATSTVLGLLPLAVSLNVNFSTLLSDLDPQLFFGSDSSMFWEPFSKTIIFGLSYATLITLLVVPILYFGVQQAKDYFSGRPNSGPQNDIVPYGDPDSSDRIFSDQERLELSE